MSNKSYDELCNEVLSLEEDIAEIEKQLNLYGMEESKDWYYRASAALKLKRAQLRFYERKLNRMEAVTPFEKAFINTAKVRLDEELYEDLVSDAHESLLRQGVTL